jgi:hypothetical protein
MQPEVAAQIPTIFDPSIVLWLFFVVALIITVYYVFAELYHWLRYNAMYPLVWIAIPVYLVGTGALIVGMLLGIAIVYV